MNRGAGPVCQRGIALLTVLLLVLVMGLLVIALLDDIRFGLRRAGNAQEMAQARWQALGSEQLARARIAALHAASPGITTLDGGWDDAPVVLPTDAGTVSARLRDGTHCFNLNSVVGGANDLVQRDEDGAADFLALLRALDLPETRAQALTDVLVDWIDSDQSPSPLGAEDADYLRGREGYRTGGTLLADPSELRAMLGFDAETCRRLRPHVCALPTTAPTPININTLREDDAMQLVAITRGAIALPEARALIASRPVSGWRSHAEFWGQPALARLQLPNRTLAQIALDTRYFRLQTRVQHGRAQLDMQALLEADPASGSVHRLSRSWSAGS